MIDQDYVELLSRTPPSGDVLEWTFSTRLFASAFAGLLVGTPALCTILHLSGVSDGDSDLRHGGVDFRVPTLTLLGENSPVRAVFTAGFHLAAVFALPLFWCVRLAHHQRLQARTGIARYDQDADGARRWVEGAWVSGALGAAFLFLSASVPGDRGGSFSLQGIAHAVFFITAGLGMVGQAACTVAATCKARRVFVVSDADLVSFRRKKWLSVAMVLSCVSAAVSVILLEVLVDRRSGAVTSADVVGNSSQSAGAMPADTGTREAFTSGLSGMGGRDCDEEWCYSRSTLALWEWVFLLLETGFCVALRHDLALSTGGVGVDSFVL
ncbi:unnamed protein product [Ascophyllum nodosum]